MPQQIRYRKQKTISITQNSFGQKVVEPLGRGMIYRELVLRLVGGCTFAAAASNAAATLAKGDEWSLIERVDIVANGTDVIRSFTGYQLWMFNRLLYGSTGKPSPTLGDGATASPIWDSTLIIPFWQPLSIKPMDTALDSSKISDLRIEVTFASAATWQSAATPTSLAATLEVMSCECFGIAGEFSDCRVYSLLSVQSAASNSVQVILPVTALYRGFLINLASSSAQNAADLPPTYTAAGVQNGGIRNVKVTSGTTVFRDAPFAALRDWQKQRLGWNSDRLQNAAATSVLSNTSALLNIRKSTLAIEDSWAYMDLVQDGYLTEGIDSVGFSEINMEIDLLTAGTLTIMPIQIFPRRTAIRAA